MLNWKQYPFIKIILPFCIGIIIALFLNTAIISFYVVLLIFFIALFLLVVANRYISYAFRWIPGAIINILLISFGFCFTTLNNEYNQSLHFSKIATDNNLYIVNISEPVEAKENSVKAIVQCIQSKRNNKWENCNGSMIIYFQKDSNAEKLKYGDLLTIHAVITEVNPPQNPAAFDYKNYLAHKNIFHQTYIKRGKWIKLTAGKGNPLKEFATELRQKLLHIFEENNINGREYAVISAILLGQTDKIDPELIKDYAGSGAIHVLSVSGMHVGLIFVSLSILLSFLDKVKRGKWIKTLLMLLAIWFYALLTGMSPSVLRASAMLSFIIIGKSLRRDADTLNILLASAFFILLFNPFLIADVGFQLSYLAVGGIILLNDAISKLFTPSNYIITKLWETTAVSIAAQIITTPVSLLYFHQFPNYFLLTNIVVLVFAGVVMYAGIFVLLVSFIPFVSTISAKILVFLVFAMNKSIGFIEGMPYAVSRGININLFECILIYIIMFALMLLIFRKAKHYAFIALSVCLLLFSSFTIKSYRQLQQQKFIVYSIPKCAVYEFINGTEQIIVADSSFIRDDNLFGFHIQNNHTTLGIHEKNMIPKIANYYNTGFSLLKKGNFILFNNQRIAIISQWNKIVLNHKMKLDYLILSGNAKTSIATVLQAFEPGLIIFDSSNSLWKTEKWENECKLLKQEYYNIQKKGAFVGNIE